MTGAGRWLSLIEIQPVVPSLIAPRSNHLVPIDRRFEPTLRSNNLTTTEPASGSISDSTLEGNHVTGDLTARDPVTAVAFLMASEAATL